MNWVASTKPAEGSSIWSTGRSASRFMNGVRLERQRAWAPMPRQHAMSSAASQNGKKPLLGPSVPQPTPSRSESQMTRRPPASSTAAVVRSAARMPPPLGVGESKPDSMAEAPRLGQIAAPRPRLLLEQAALDHQVLVLQLGGLKPLDVLGARQPGRLERALVQVILELGRLIDLLEEALVPVDGFLRHVGGAEDTPKHQVLDVHAEGVLHGRDVLPLGDGNPGSIEHGKRPHPSGPSSSGCPHPSVP